MSDEIKPQYGFQLCSADDKDRTHFFFLNGWIECCRCETCLTSMRQVGFTYRKPILLPDGKRDGESAEWQLVTSGIERGDLAFDRDSNSWHDNYYLKFGRTPNEIAETHGWYVAFARRKASPRTDGWEPRSDDPNVDPLRDIWVFCDDAAEKHINLWPSQSYRNQPVGLRWRYVREGELPAPPAPEKSEAERLADEYVESRNIRNSGYETAVHRGFMAGYEAGRKG